MAIKMKAKTDEIWDMINQLPSKEKEKIYKRLQEDTCYKLNSILDRVNERAEKEPIPMAEITEEVDLARKLNYEQQN